MKTATVQNIASINQKGGKQPRMNLSKQYKRQLSSLTNETQAFIPLQPNYA